MREEIKDLLYKIDDGLLYRLRDGQESATEEERAKILEFAKVINSKIKNSEAIDQEDFVICIDMIEKFSSYEDSYGLCVELRRALIDNLDFHYDI